MPEVTPRERFIASLDRCTDSDKFIPAFYERFLDSSTEIRSKFTHTDFESQNLMLVRSLKLAAGSTSGEVESLRELRERAETHDRHHLNIKPAHYEVWLETVIQVAQEFDPHWHDEIEVAWREILGFVILRMVKYY
ncbi:MAG: hemoglobin-like flavoprotein [Mariniblastus sp.]|jgi:hemoglobin-like flavoprotein